MYDGSVLFFHKQRRLATSVETIFSLTAPEVCSVVLLLFRGIASFCLRDVEISERQASLSSYRVFNANELMSHERPSIGSVTLKGFGATTVGPRLLLYRMCKTPNERQTLRYASYARAQMYRIYMRTSECANLLQQ